MRRSFLDSADRTLIYAESALNAFICIDNGHFVNGDRVFGTNVRTCTASGAFGFLNGYHLDNLGRQIHELV